MTQRWDTTTRWLCVGNLLADLPSSERLLGAKKRDLYQFHQRRCNKRCSGVVQFITCHVSATTHAGRLRRGVGTRMPRAGRVEQYAHAWDQGAAYLEVLATLNRGEQPTAAQLNALMTQDRVVAYLLQQVR